MGSYKFPNGTLGACYQQNITDWNYCGSGVVRSCLRVDDVCRCSDSSTCRILLPLWHAARRHQHWVPYNKLAHALHPRPGVMV